MSKRLNELMISELARGYADLDAGIMVDYMGGDAPGATALRAEFLKQGIEIKVMKNRIASLAFQRAGHAGVAELLDGPSALVTGAEDPVLLAKAVAAAVQSKALAGVRGGYVEGQVLTSEGVRELAKLPSREVLLAQVLGGISSPMVALACAFGSLASSLARVLDAIREKKEQAEQAG